MSQVVWGETQPRPQPRPLHVGLSVDASANKPEASFVAAQECGVDDKRRFSLPPRYRPLYSQLETPSGYTYKVVLLPWYGGPIMAIPLATWKRMEARILRLDFTTPDFLDAKRQFFSRVEYTHTDPEGRLTLTPGHYAWLRLNPKGKDRVMAVGVGSHLEIWNAEEWAEVERTGRNSAARPAAEVQYDKFLEELMRAVPKEEPAQGSAGGGADAAGGSLP